MATRDLVLPTAVDFPPEEFTAIFQRIAGFEPYPWQVKAAETLWTTNQFPRNLALPTGTGKTSAIVCWLVIWYLALRYRPAHLPPRRLFYCVDRRAIIDQAYVVIQRLLARLRDDAELLEPFTSFLAPFTDFPIGLSALRGEQADNQEWSALPQRPSVIVTTIDMIGSKLLFCGYGDGSWHRPFHAGLAGTDALLIFDECHLSQAFTQTLGYIVELNPEGWSYTLMSATSTGEDFELSKDDWKNSHLASILNAPKKLKITETKKYTKDAVKLATTKPPARTIVFVRTPEDALYIAEQISAKFPNTRLLTGTLRGWERDALATNPIFQAFRTADGPAEPHFLVATSAGECGIDLTCDRLISDQAEINNLLQRFGRLNRFAESRKTDAILLTKKPENEIEAGIKYLRSLGGDISTANLWRHRHDKLLAAAQLDPKPCPISLPEWVLNRWSATSLSLDGAPPVSLWLRGEADEDARVEFLWRTETQMLADMEESDWRDYFDAVPPASHELLNEPLVGGVRKMQDLLKTPGEILVVKADGRRINRRQLDEMGERQLFSILSDATVYLLPGLGGLAHGMLAPTVESDSTIDIFENTIGDKQRVRITVEEDSDALDAYPRSAWRVLFRMDNFYVLSHRQKKTPNGNGGTVSLAQHAEEVSRVARLFATQCGLEPELVDILVAFGTYHDGGVGFGKGNPIWQAAAGGDVAAPVAKSSYLNGRAMAGFRHEFDVVRHLSSQGAPELLIHLIASHHKGGRPSYRDTGNLSPRDHAQILRFAQLQQTMGWWKLAFIEAVAKGADRYVSN